MQNNVLLVLAVIISLVIGGGGTYAINSSQLTILAKEKGDLQTEKNYLKTQVETLSSEKNQLNNQVASLKNQVSTLDAEKTSFQTQVSSLTSENAALNSSIDILADTIDAIHSLEWKQTATYNITAGTSTTKSFIIDRYGIIWDVEIEFSGTSMKIEHYYWYKEVRYFVNSYNTLLTQSYGYQDYLTGTIKLDISAAWSSSNRILFVYLTNTQFPYYRLSGSMYATVDS